MNKNDYACEGRELLEDFIENNFETNMIDIFDSITSLYMQINEIINISSLKNPNDIYVKHYLDSIVPYKYICGSCCDVGCGGGFPCIPLAVVTENEYLGIDGVGKKLSLIKKCNTELGIKNVDCLHARAEEIKKTHEPFDTVCARAVADTDKVLSYCAPLAKKGGKIVLYKTPNEKSAKSETEKKLKIELLQTEDYVLPGTDVKRRLFVYSKL